MEPKWRNEGHGYYILKFWSYKDQTWKKMRGSNDLAAVIQKHIQFWPTFINHLLKHVSQIEGVYVQEAREHTKEIRLIASFAEGEPPFCIALRKSNLLKILVRNPLKRDLSEVIMACKRAILDDDFADKA